MTYSLIDRLADLGTPTAEEAIAHIAKLEKIIADTIDVGNACMFGLEAQLAAKDALIRELVGAVSDAKSVLSNCSVEAGYCCCGDSIESHGIYSGHSPVDMGAYSAEKAVDKATAALTRAKEMGYE